MSHGYETEQAELKTQLAQLSEFIEKSEAKKADTAKFINIVRKYTDLSELTPEIMHEFIEKIVVHAPDKSSGRRKQKIEIYLRFKVAVMDTVLDCKDYDKKKKGCVVRKLRNLYIKLLYRLLFYAGGFLIFRGTLIVIEYLLLSC